MDIKRMRELAGIDYHDGMSVIKNTVAPVHKLTERWHDDDDDYGDDDDLSSAERELAKVASKDLKKRGVDTDAELAAIKRKERAKDDKKDDDKEHDRQTAKPVEKKPVEKPAEKKDDKPADKDDKKDDDKKDDDKESDGGRGASVFGAMAKDLEKSTKDSTPKRGRGRSETERTGQFRTWVVNNPNATRKDAMEYGASLGMNPKHVNTKFYQFRKSVKEFWVIVNPSNARVLAEHSTMNRPIWVSYDDVNTFDSWIFLSESEAKDYADKLLNAGAGEVVLMSFGDSDADE